MFSVVGSSELYVCMLVGVAPLYSFSYENPILSVICGLIVLGKRKTNRGNKMYHMAWNVWTVSTALYIVHKIRNLAAGICFHSAIIALVGLSTDEEGKRPVYFSVNWNGLNMSHMLVEYVHCSSCSHNPNRDLSNLILSLKMGTESRESSFNSTTWPNQEESMQHLPKCFSHTGNTVSLLNCSWENKFRVGKIEKFPSNSFNSRCLNLIS